MEPKTLKLDYFVSYDNRIIQATRIRILGDAHTCWAEFAYGSQTRYPRGSRARNSINFFFLADASILEYRISRRA